MGMQREVSAVTIAPDTSQGSPDWPELHRQRRAIVVVDVVESVRLMQANEADVIDRWRRFVNEVRTQVLPAQGGRMVKSLGDGMLLEFQTVLGAINTAFDVHRRIQAYNAARVPAEALRVRVGVHEAEIVVDEFDVYGAGVNLAARLATLAGPGEIIISPEARDALVPGLDVDIEDLGDCYLKHFAEPQRAYRAGPLGGQPVMWSGTAAGVSDRACVAVIPFAAGGDRGAPGLLGEVIADDLIAQLSRMPQLHVVSRLSTTVFRQRELDLKTLTAALGSQYVVHGSCTVNADKVRLRAQLVDCHDAAVVWADALDGSVADVLGGASPIVEQLTMQVCHALMGAELRRAATMPLPSLQSYTILLGAIAMMHRLSLRDFDRSRDMLLYLIERHPRATAPRAWLGKWHVMRVAQGWSPNPVADAREAHGVVAQALDLDPEHSLALAIDGLICAYINKDLATAAQRYEASVRVNPSESLAWLFQSALHSYAQRGELAVECALRAQRLSPLDPMKYYYDNFTSTAKLSAGDYLGAIEYGKKSLRDNRTHGPTLRILAIAEVLAGRLEDARATIADVLKVEPTFSVSRFLDRYPGAAAPHASMYAEALRTAGLPD
jgi:adenylate cyclase